VGSIVPEPKSDRFARLDGLRGFLALFVLSHHSLYWYGNLTGGSWTMPSIFTRTLANQALPYSSWYAAFSSTVKFLQRQAANLTGPDLLLYVYPG
jgi:hypothetical protein